MIVKEIGEELTEDDYWEDEGWKGGGEEDGKGVRDGEQGHGVESQAEGHGPHEPL